MDETIQAQEQTTQIQQLGSRLQERTAQVTALPPQFLVEIFEVEVPKGGAVVQLSGELDLATGPRLDAAFREVADRRLTEVIVDASRVTFMDSVGVHALVQGKTRIHEVCSRIVLVPSPRVRRVLELVSPEPLFAARVDSMEKARETLGWT